MEIGGHADKATGKHEFFDDVKPVRFLPTHKAFRDPDLLKFLKHFRAVQREPLQGGFFVAAKLKTRKTNNWRLIGLEELPSRSQPASLAIYSKILRKCDKIGLFHMRWA